MTTTTLDPWGAEDACKCDDPFEACPEHDGPAPWVTEPVESLPAGQCEDCQDYLNTNPDNLFGPDPCKLHTCVCSEKAGLCSAVEHDCICDSYPKYCKLHPHTPVTSGVEPPPEPTVKPDRKRHPGYTPPGKTGVAPAGNRWPDDAGPHYAGTRPVRDQNDHTVAFMKDDRIKPKMGDSSGAAVTAALFAAQYMIVGHTLGTSVVYRDVEANISSRKLGERAGMGHNTAARALAALVELGYLVRLDDRAGGTNGKNSAGLYRPAVNPAWTSSTDTSKGRWEWSMRDHS